MPKLYSAILLLFVTLSLILTSFSLENEKWYDKVSPALHSRYETANQSPVMIYFKDQSRLNENPYRTKLEKGKMVFEKLQQKALKSQSQVSVYLEKQNIPYRSFYIVNAIQTSLNSLQLREIASMEQTSYISYDSPVQNKKSRIEKTDNVHREGTPEWGLQIIQADKVWAMGIRGEGTVVGGQDTGYDWTHPALKSKYRGYIDEDNVDHNYNWHDAIHEISPLHNDSIVDPSNNPCGLDIDYPCADGGHGTHTMGTMVGLDGDNVIGVAPGAKWIGVRNMERGWGKPSTYLESFEWFLAPTDLNGENPDPAKAPHVINNSWSCPLIEGCDESNWQYLDMAINNLRAAGVFVVVSASNNGNACGRINAPPGIYEGAFSVGATQIIDTIDGVFMDDIAGYSSWGPVMVDSSQRMKPDISAPGSRVRSSTPGNNYGTSSGTSMAGPHVAGLVALIISANPALAGKVDDIEEIIQMTADQKTRNDSCGIYSALEIPNFIYGYGRINALKAIEAALLYTDTYELDLINNDVNIYPNPSNKHLNIDWKSEQSNSNLKILDQNGRLKTFTNIAKGQVLDISNLPSGMYILKLNIDNRIITKN